MASSSLVLLPCLSSQKMTFKPMAALSNPPRTAIPYELKKGQSRLFHKHPSGLKMVKVMNLWEQLLEHFRNDKCISRTFRGCTCLLGAVVFKFGML